MLFRVSEFEASEFLGSMQGLELGVDVASARRRRCRFPALRWMSSGL